MKFFITWRFLEEFAYLLSFRIWIIKINSIFCKGKRKQYYWEISKEKNFQRRLYILGNFLASLRCRELTFSLFPIGAKWRWLPPFSFHQVCSSTWVLPPLSSAASYWLYFRTPSLSSNHIMAIFSFVLPMTKVDLYRFYDLDILDFWQKTIILVFASHQAIYFQQPFPLKMFWLLSRFPSRLFSFSLFSSFHFLLFLNIYFFFFFIQLFPLLFTF